MIFRLCQRYALSIDTIICTSKNSYFKITTKVTKCSAWKIWKLWQCFARSSDKENARHGTKYNPWKCFTGHWESRKLFHVEQ